MPALGVAQQTGTLLKWLKAEGQSVSKGEPLMEIETDKVDSRDRSAGFRRIRASDGEGRRRSSSRADDRGNSGAG